MLKHFLQSVYSKTNSIGLFNQDLVPNNMVSTNIPGFWSWSFDILIIRIIWNSTKGLNILQSTHSVEQTTPHFIGFRKISPSFTHKDRPQESKNYTARKRYVITEVKYSKSALGYMSLEYTDSHKKCVPWRKMEDDEQINKSTVQDIIVAIAREKYKTWPSSSHASLKSFNPEMVNSWTSISLHFVLRLVRWHFVLRTWEMENYVDGKHKQYYWLMHSYFNLHASFIRILTTQSIHNIHIKEWNHHLYQGWCWPQPFLPK